MPQAAEQLGVGLHPTYGVHAELADGWAPSVVLGPGLLLPTRVHDRRYADLCSEDVDRY
jgi:hypothetical protein